MKFVLSITHNCNLACSYCYAGKKFKRDMSPETAKAIVDFSLAIAPSGDALEYGFFGGEPLLRFELIREIVAYARQRGGSRPLGFQVTTNGTTLTARQLAFLREQDIGLCVSVDGVAEIHDRNRRFRNGRGSFNAVMRNLAVARDSLEKVQVNAVYGRDSLAALAETVGFFVALDIPLIHLNPDITTEWTAHDLSLFEKSYREVADVYVASYRAGKPIAVNQIDSKVIVFLKGGYEPSDRCGMGDREWGFAPSGNIYPCERFIGEDDGGEFCLGNVHTGLHLASQCAVLKKRGNRNLECADCSLEKYCMNWCGCTNHFMTGRTDIAGPLLCANEKAAIGAAQQVLADLKEDGLFIDHFYSYLKKERHSLARM